MKRLVKTLVALMFVFNVSTLLAPKESAAQSVSVSFQLFYDELSPYGSWVDYPGYGYVWIPSNTPGFYPYSSNGYWEYTYCGWTWVSNYHWGWAPFHYGRWHYDPFYGWLWMPGNQWGPAWVVWAHNDGYYGWAPMGPGMSINMYYNTTYIPSEQWVFVNKKEFGGHNYNYAPRSSNASIIKNSKVIENEYHDQPRGENYISGPKRDEVQKVTGRSVQQVDFKENKKPGQSVSKNELTMYRPEVKKSNDAGREPAPTKVHKLDEIKAAKGANAGEQSGMDKGPRTNKQESYKNEPAKKESSPTYGKQQPAEQEGWKSKRYNQPATSPSKEGKMERKPSPAIKKQERSQPKMEKPGPVEMKKQEQQEPSNKPLKQGPSIFKKSGRNSDMQQAPSQSPSKKEGPSRKPR